MRQAYPASPSSTGETPPDAVTGLHVVPEPDDPPHRLDGFCWCQPLAERHLGGVLYIHRRSLDSPHIEPDPGPSAVRT